MKNFCFVISLIIGILFMGCQFQSDYVELMELPSLQRHERFKQLPIDKQVEFYLLRASSSHPLDLSFAEDIATRGEEAIPYLLERLKKEKEDNRRHHIVRIIFQIHVDVSDLRNKKEVISILENTVDQIIDPDWKKMTQRLVQHIKSSPPKFAPDYDPEKLNEPPPRPPKIKLSKAIAYQFEFPRKREVGQFIKFVKL